MSPADEPPEPSIEEFLGEAPTQEPADWRRLWEADLAFPVRSHRGLVGRLVVAVKRLLRPLVRAPLGDLWDRQQSFNLVLLNLREQDLGQIQELRDRVGDLLVARRELLRDLRQVRDDLAHDVRHHHKRLEDLETYRRDGLADLLRHVDSLFALVDQKLDRYHATSRRMWGRLGALIAAAERPETGAAAALDEPFRERRYVELEEKFRGSEDEVGRRAAAYLDYLDGRGEVLDLGCGRGELLAALAGRGIAARGVDASADMVQLCRGKGLAVERGDLLSALRDAADGSLGAIVSLHVIEHLPAAALERLVPLAWRALRPGGVLILETPNPLSLVVSARNFWLDPTHQRPVHPEVLQLWYEQAGFEQVELLEMRPFADEERLPELDLSAVEDGLKPLAEQINRLRDRLDGLLYGFQDYALIGTKPAADG